MAARVALSPTERTLLARRLSKSSTFRTANLHHILQLLEHAKQVVVQPREVICVEDQDVVAGIVLVEGEYKLVGRGRVDIIPDGGAIIGLLESIVGHQKHSVTIEAITKCTYVEIVARHIEHLYRHSPPFADALAGALPMQDTGRVSEPAIVRFEIAEELRHLPASVLVDLVAQEIASTFPDWLVILKPGPQDARTSPRRAPMKGRGHLQRDAARGRSAEELRREWRDYDYIFVDPSISTDEAPEHDILVKLVSRPAPRLIPSPGEPWVLDTVVIPEGAKSCSKSLDLIDANDDAPVTMSACRLHLQADVQRLRAVDFVPLDSVDESLRASLGRWARALTMRRTGIAIGGGGVFAMMGVFVIRELVKKKIPIDIIAGTSGGSLVGGYYAARGLDGLEELVHRADNHELGAAVLGAYLSGAVLQWFVGKTLGHPCIEHLRYAEFFPAISDLTKGKGMIAVNGPLALGIRASGAAPPLFPAAILDRQHLVDGAFTNNVPVQAVQRLGATVTLGLNVYPPSRIATSRSVDERLMNLDATLNPIARVVSAWTGANLLASHSGRIQSSLATAAYNAESVDPAPYYTVPSFYRASEIIEKASRDVTLAKTIDEFVAAWEAVRDRGTPWKRGRAS